MGEDEPNDYPDTGESGETFDVEKLGENLRRLLGKPVKGSETLPDDESSPDSSWNRNRQSRVDLANPGKEGFPAVLNAGSILRLVSGHRQCNCRRVG